MSKRNEQKLHGINYDIANSITLLHNSCLDRPHRQVFLHGTLPLNDVELGLEPGVEYSMVAMLTKNLHLLCMDSEEDPVLIHLQTCGGYYEQGMAIYNTIRLMPYPVAILSYTHARSMSSIILQAGDFRALMPDSYFMIHEGGLEVAGEYGTVVSNVEFDKIGGKRMIEIYTEKIRLAEKFKGWSDARISKMLKRKMDEKHDFFFTPEQAVEWNFADEVFDGDWKALSTKAVQKAFPNQ
ncbi:MAG: ATP-dependent Clp protease proteolytic subunit [Candidatus Buchananbacteria bacterium]|jgi:ATP-dependent protease ClpP protease subunit